MDDFILINDLIILEKLICSSKRITIVLDNAGFELFSDLCLAHLIMLHTDCDEIVFEMKDKPWFVSDVTLADFHFVIDSVSELNPEIGSAWKQHISQGRWILKCHAFWTTVYSFWNMPEKAPELYKSLNESNLVIFKGDLNYRKVVYLTQMVNDSYYAPGTPFYESIGPWANAAASFAMLRTLKSDPILNVSAQQVQELDAKSKDWRVNGNYGLIQVHSKLF